jgi:hypothetical protein
MSNLPAFPTTKPLDSWDDPNQGMDLRDYFAAKAMSAWLIHAGVTAGQAPTQEDLARYSYEMADAMMKARGLCSDTK